MRILFNKQLFEEPFSIIKCHKLSEVEGCFERMEKALSRGFYLAGFLSYEAGYAFESFSQNKKTYDFPLVCFGVYTEPTSPPNHVAASAPPLHLRWRGGWGVRRNYLAAVRKIKRYLAAGETYQVNYTFKQKFSYQGKPCDLYQKLKLRQPTSYSAFIETNDFSILSLSPELFFRKDGNRIKVKPMKGTIAPGKINEARLRNDPKNRSENIMIVDLLRNDLGRIAKTGSVRTPWLFEIEKHPTLYQMTSTVEAKVPKNIGLFPLFKNVFPSGSVTGAPKIRTMQIIRELEKEERKIYCGSIGLITPLKDMIFNVAIRTVLLETRNPQPATGEMGVGSGITYDSDPEKEYEECLLKSRFLFAD